MLSLPRNVKMKAGALGDTKHHHPLLIACLSGKPRDTYTSQALITPACAHFCGLKSMHVSDTVMYTLTKQGGQGGCTFPMVPHGPAVPCAVKLLIQWMLYMRPCCWLGAGPKVQHPPSCVLCPVSGPPLRQTSCGRFCHVGCAQWLGETFIQGGLVHGLRHVSKVITSLRPSLLFAALYSDLSKP